MLDSRGRPKQLPTSGFDPTSTSTSMRKSSSKIKFNRVPSNSKLNNPRPNLGRSKSSDTLIRIKPSVSRNNRSYTKLSTLQPLTRTTSNSGIKTVKSNGSPKNLGQGLKSNGFKNLGQPAGLKSSGKKEKAILRFNDDTVNEEYEDIDTVDEHRRSISLNDIGELNKITDSSGGLSKGTSNSTGGLIRENNSTGNFNRVDSTLDVNSGSHSEIDDEGISMRNTSRDFQKNAEGARNDFSGRDSRNHVDETRNDFSGREFQHNAGNNYSDREDSSRNGDSNQKVSSVEHELRNSDSRGVENNRKLEKNESNYSSNDGFNRDLQALSKSNLANSNVDSSNASESNETYTDYNRAGNDYNGYNFDKQTKTPNSNSGIVSNLSSNDDISNNMYGGSLLLSQSTGLTKKIDPKLQYSNVNSVNIPAQLSAESLQSESISGISFKANRFELAEPITTSKTVIPSNSYQTNQSILNNLTRSGNKAKPIPENVDFSNFLNSSKDQADLLQDNRTQQRLWLQRENSLMDVANVDNFSLLSLNNLMFSHNQSRPNVRDYFNSKPVANNTNSNVVATPTIPKPVTSTTNINGLLNVVQSGSSIQSRTEFERTNREYLNVRRHLNPVGESLHRLETLKKSNLVVDKSRNKNSNTSFKNNDNNFKQFSPRYQEKEHQCQLLLQKVWQEAVQTIQNRPEPPSIGGTNVSTPRGLPQRIDTNGAPRSLTNQSSMSNFRSPQSQTPNTRAVKFAQGGSMKKEVPL